MLRLVYEYIMVVLGYQLGKITFRIEYADGSKRLKTVQFRRSLDIQAAANKLYFEDTHPSEIDDIHVAYWHGCTNS